MSLKIPALSSDLSDIGDAYMVSRHRRIILEQLGLERDEIPNNAKDQVVMLKAFRAEQNEMYIKLFNLYVRGISEDGETLRSKAETVESLKKQVLSEIRAFAENENQSFKDGIVSYSEVLIVNTKNKFDDLKRKTNNDFLEAEKQIDGLCEHFESNIESIVNEQLDKTRKVVYSVKVADKIEANLGEIILPEEFQQIMELAANRINILLVGPSGCGKSHISEIVSKALSLPFYGQSCSAGMSESIFSGWLLPIGNSGKFSYVESPFVRAYENGGVFLFDEIDGADGNTLLFLNQALANKHFFLPQRFENPVVKKHENFVAIAAANTYGAGADSLYNSRNALDAASMDRFRMGTVKMDYSTKVEEKFVDKKLLEIGREIRNIIKNKNLRKILTTRFLIDATTMKKAGWTEGKIFESYLQDWSVEERKQVQNLLQPMQQKSPVNRKVYMEDTPEHPNAPSRVIFQEHSMNQIMENFLKGKFR